MANKFPYSIEYNNIAQYVESKLPWMVVKRGKIIAHCISEEDAELVKNALNFNYRAHMSCYKLVD